MVTEESEEVIGWRDDDAGGRNIKDGGCGWGKGGWEWETDSRLGITSTLVCAPGRVRLSHVHDEKL